MLFFQRNFLPTLDCNAWGKPIQHFIQHFKIVVGWNVKRFQRIFSTWFSFFISSKNVINIVVKSPHWITKRVIIGESSGKTTRDMAKQKNLRQNKTSTNVWFPITLTLSNCPNYPTLKFWWPLIIQTKVFIIFETKLDSYGSLVVVTVLGQESLEF